MPSRRLLSLALAILISANSGVLAATTPAASEIASAQTAAPVYEEMAKLVKDYYPKAKVTIDKTSIHFEFKAHLRMSPSQRLELAPDPEGIVGDVKLAAGEYRGSEPVPRENDQRFHIILTMAPFNPQANAHIFTKLYYPPGTVPEFLVQFKRLVEGFATQPVTTASATTPAASTTASPLPTTAPLKPVSTAAASGEPAPSAISSISSAERQSGTPTTAVAAVEPKSSPAPSAGTGMPVSPQFAKGKLRKRVLAEDGVSVMLPADATRKKYGSKALTASCYQCADFPHGEFRVICLQLPENSTLSGKALETLCSEIGRVLVPNSGVRFSRAIKIKELSGLFVDLSHDSQSQPKTSAIVPALQTLGSDMSEWLKNYGKDFPLVSAKTNAPSAKVQALISGPKVYVLFAAGRPVWLNSNIVTEAFDSLEIGR